LEVEGKVMATRVDDAIKKAEKGKATCALRV